MELSASSHESRGTNVKYRSYLVIDFKLSSGESIPLVVQNDTREPQVLVLRYILIAYRSPGSSSATIRNVCQGIALGLSFIDHHQIDLMERLASGRLLSREELATFAHWCLTRADGQGTVVTQYAKRRFLDFVDFLLWQLEAVMHRATTKDLRFLNDQRNAFKSRSLAQCPKGNAGAAQRDRLGLTDKQRELLLEVIRPESPRNPFKTKLRRRNHAMILLHYRYGLRAGELAGLYRSDYHNLETPAQLYIHTRHNNLADRRVQPPRAKTRPRMLEIAGDAKIALDAWLNDRADRAEFPLARKSQYIFVNGKGREISLRAAFDIFGYLRKIYPELGPIASHVLRHDMNERWVENGEKFGWDQGQIAEDQCYVNGWAEGSTMPQVYSKTAIRNRANRRIFELQNKSVS